MSSPPSLLQVSGLSRTFGGLKAVDDVSFEVSAGSITGLIGPNGAGKTTTLNMISGLLSPSRGDVSVDGQSLSGSSPDAVARRGIARTFQTPQLFPALSVLENVMVGAGVGLKSPGLLAETLRLPNARRRATEMGTLARHWIDFVGLGQSQDAFPEELPFGRLRLLELARAAAAHPRLLLLDEPSSGLSSDETGGFKQLINHLRANGATVLLVEHNMRLVMSTVDRVVVLDRGRKIADGPPEAVRRNREVQTAYLGTVVA